MAQTKAEIRKAWDKENLDRVTITMKKEVKARWKSEAESRGISLGKMATLAIEEYLEKN